MGGLDNKDLFLERKDFMSKTFEVRNGKGYEKKNYDDILKINKWHNVYGNPSYGVLMNNGEQFILVDDYGFCPSYADCDVKYVKRRKDLQF